MSKISETSTAVIAAAELNTTSSNAIMNDVNPLQMANVERRMQRADLQDRVTCQKRTYTVNDVADMLDISRSSAYDLIKQGHFKTVRIGTAIRISKASFDKWLDTQD